MKTCSILLLVLLWFTCTNVQGQVTIGADVEPVKGVLLDLKQEQTNGTENSQKGLVLPRVQLTDISKLYPMFTSGYNSNEDKNHVGLMVYNTVANAPFCRGVYVWTGTEWQPLGPCITQYWSKSNIYWSETDQSLTFEETDMSKQGWQGVYFKYGSLVGISPVATESIVSSYDENSVMFFIPEVISGTYTGNWLKLSPQQAKAAGIFSGTAWTNVPYDNVNYNVAEFGSLSHWDYNELYRHTVSAVGMPIPAGREYLGDICRFLSTTGKAKSRLTRDWATPSGRMFAYYGDNSSETYIKWDNTTSQRETVSAVNKDGTTPLNRSLRKFTDVKGGNSGEDIYLPSSGSRAWSGANNAGGGSMTNHTGLLQRTTTTGQSAYYRSASQYNDGGERIVYLSLNWNAVQDRFVLNTNNSSIYQYYRDGAMPVRCVRSDHPVFRN